MCSELNKFLKIHFTFPKLCIIIITNILLKEKRNEDD